MAPRKIIVDTDPGVDDVLAILMALASPEVDVALISIVFGNTHAPVAHANLLKIYHNLALEIASMPTAASRYARLTAQDKTVLALGEDGPIGGAKAVAAYFHGPDGLSNISQTHPHFTPPTADPADPHAHLVLSDRPAHEAMLELLRTEPEGSVTIVALGPLTNLAHALRADPAAFARVGAVVWMGGALDVPGNTAPTAEFNCYADPYAAQAVVNACRAGAFALIMAPLDITTPHQIAFDDLIHPAVVASSGNPEQAEVRADYEGTPPTPLQAFTSAFLLRVRGLQASFGNPDAMEMHDPVAVWYAIALAGAAGPVPVPDGWRVQPRAFQVERTGEWTRGMCVVDRRGTGETGLRTENAQLQGNAVPALPKQQDVTGARLPLVITHTPGTAELRRLLLGRVFGVEV
ncbi:hypothetical protein Q5752_001045 [Cryptotrichosporon argae]